MRHSAPVMDVISGKASALGYELDAYLARTEEDEYESERERRESLEDELKELRLVLLEEICGEIESELSLIEPGVCWRPNDLDDDKLWRLAEAAVCKAKQIKGVVEALREL